MAVRKTRGSESKSPAGDDFYQRLRKRIDGWAERNEIRPAYRDSLMALPDLFHLLTRLMLDKRVDAFSKTILGVAIAYVVSPIDLIPDILGPLGFVDDLLIVVLALDMVLVRVPRPIVEEHWAGRGDLMDIVRDCLDRADRWVGSGMWRRIREYIVSHGWGGASEAEATASAAGRKPAAAARKGPAAVAKERTTARAKASAVKATTAASGAARKTSAAASRKKATTARRPAATTAAPTKRAAASSSRASGTAPKRAASASAAARKKATPGRTR